MRQLSGLVFEGLYQWSKKAMKGSEETVRIIDRDGCLDLQVLTHLAPSEKGL